MKQLMIEAEIYAVYEEEQPVAFIGLVGNYIAGIFILKDYQKKGYGKKLLKVAQQKYSELHLSVYEKNQNAVAFYKYQNFIIIEQKMDENNEVEYLMVWTK
ncbi:GNAT family N-acetyltransferase [Enterococcus rivorum]|uniref:GNAT family N-acetyltransferase n=1 Tax=Enterococcus rivorum TaxID=762845 RepID=UPI003629FD41